MKSFSLLCLLSYQLVNVASKDTSPISNRLQWSYWLNRDQSSKTTTTTPAPVAKWNQSSLTYESNVAGLGLSKGLKVTQCGVPRKSNYDPFSLSDANLGVWNDKVINVGGKAKKNVTVVPTIVGGRTIDPREACWQAKLHRDGYFICGGSIVGKRTILTASHCVLDFSNNAIYRPNKFRVTVGAPKSDTNVPGGSIDPTGCSKDFGVVRVVSNSRFSRSTNENDIAVLTLDADIDYTKDCVCPICLSATIPKIGEMCAVSGYGLLEEGGDSSGARPLKFVHLNILPTTFKSNCYIQRGSGGTSVNLNNILCAGDVPGEDTCQGDSGGPVVCQDPVTHKHYQVGIVSYGLGCARGIGGVYTRVSSYLSWIQLNSGIDVSKSLAFVSKP